MCRVTAMFQVLPKKALKVHVWQENATPAVPSRRPEDFFRPPPVSLGAVLQS